MKRLLLGVAALLLSTTAVVPIQAMAQHTSVSINIGTAPPPLRYERMPPPRHGYVWAPGYWNWNGYQHVWAQGHWVRARPGYAYQRPQWRQDHGHWNLHQGGWQQNRNDKHYRKDKHHNKNHGYHCPPGQAKKGNC